jgi:hypothetical protein
MMRDSHTLGYTRREICGILGITLLVIAFWILVAMFSS